MLLNPFTYHAPKNTDQAIKLYANLKHAKFLAGGTIFINLLKKQKTIGLQTPKHIISLKKIKTLKKISTKKQTIDIGAMTTCKDIIGSEMLLKKCPALVSAARSIGTTQIRNMATIGGNLMSRFTWTEFQTPLIALESNLCFLDSKGKIKMIKAENFFKKGANSNDLLAKIIIPLHNQSLAIYSRMPRRANPDIPIISMCIKAHFTKDCFTHVVAALNTSSGFTQRCHNIENALCGLNIKNYPEESFFKKISIPSLAKNDDYKQALIKTMLKNAIHGLCAQVT